MALILRTPQAEEDIIEIWFYIAVEKQSALNADRFMDKLDKQLTFLAQNPGIGTPKNQYIKGLYQFIFGNYLIFYFPLSNGIEIIRVLHGARDLDTLF